MVTPKSPQANKRSISFRAIRTVLRNKATNANNSKAPRARNKMKTVGLRYVGITPFARTWLAPYIMLTANNAPAAQRSLLTFSKTTALILRQIL